MKVVIISILNTLILASVGFGANVTTNEAPESGRLQAILKLHPQIIVVHHHYGPHSLGSSSHPDSSIHPKPTFWQQITGINASSTPGSNDGATLGMDTLSPATMHGKASSSIASANYFPFNLHGSEVLQPGSNPVVAGTITNPPPTGLPMGTNYNTGVNFKSQTAGTLSISAESGTSLGIIPGAGQPSSSQIHTTPITIPPPPPPPLPSWGITSIRTNVTTPNSVQPMDTIEKLLKTPGQPMPWKWWQQCFNDRVHKCTPELEQLQHFFDTDAATAMKDVENAALKPVSTAESANKRTFYAMALILANKVPTFKNEEIPYHTYWALEILLGMGFTASKGLPSSIAARRISLDAFLQSPPTPQVRLIPIARLGLHRLMAALLDLENVRFTEDNSVLRDLLASSRDQPYVLTQLLKRVSNHTLRKSLATQCPMCSPLATAIHKALGMEFGPITPLCASNGEKPIKAVHSHFLDTLNGQLNGCEQVMLARAFLYLVFDVPLAATNCPGCAWVTGASPTKLVNAMLECYCTPRSVFHLLD